MARETDWNDVAERIRNGESHAQIARIYGAPSGGAMERRVANARKAGLMPDPLPARGTHGESVGAFLWVSGQEIASLRKQGFSWREICERIGVPATKLGTLHAWMAKGIGGWMRRESQPQRRPNRIAKRTQPTDVAKVNNALAKSNGHKPIASTPNPNGNGHSNGHGDPVLRAAIAQLLPTLNERNVIYVEIDNRRREVRYAQVNTISLDPH